MPKVTPEHEQRRREQILVAALTCFSRQGYRATSMDDIVQESGLSVGAIYTYFASKEELFMALAEQRHQETLAYLERLFQQPGSLHDLSSQAVDYFFAYIENESAPWARLTAEFWSEAHKSEKLHELHAQRCESIRGFLVWLFRESQRRGEMPPDADVEVAAELLMALNDGIVMHRTAGVQPVPLERLKRGYLALLDQGLSAVVRPPDAGATFGEAPSSIRLADPSATGARNGAHVGGIA